MTTIEPLSILCVAEAEGWARARLPADVFDFIAGGGGDEMRDLVRRAEGSGYSALMITVDVPVMARRRRDLRHGFTLPAGVAPANLDGEAPGPDWRRPGVSAVAAHTDLLFDPSAGWADLEWLRRQTSLPLLVKGILDPRDAVRAVDVGVAGIVVSNHGGRQFDGAPASIAVLPAVRDAVRDKCTVLLDSGVRSGLDVLRALALGADGVLLGRPLLWALAAGGEAGARALLALLRAELTEALVLAGCVAPDAARRLWTVTGSGSV